MLVKTTPTLINYMYLDYTCVVATARRFLLLLTCNLLFCTVELLEVNCLTILLNVKLSGLFSTFTWCCNKQLNFAPCAYKTRFAV